MRKLPKPNLAFSEAERARVPALSDRPIAELIRPQFLPESCGPSGKRGKSSGVRAGAKIGGMIQASD
jgi:hypothetical protein